MADILANNPLVEAEKVPNPPLNLDHQAPGLFNNHKKGEFKVFVEKTGIQN